MTDGLAVDVIEPDLLNPWPLTAPKEYQDCMALLSQLWELDRKYTWPELFVLAQARLSLARERRIPRQIFDGLHRVHRQHLTNELARRQMLQKYADANAAAAGQG